MIGRPRGVRARLLVTTVGVVAVALAVGIAAMYVLLGRHLSATATASAQSQARAEVTSLELRAGRLVVPPDRDREPFTSMVWVFDGARAIERPRVPAEVDRIAASLATGPERWVDIGERTRLYALPAIFDGRRYGTVVSAVSLVPFEETGRVALIGAVILGAGLLVAVALLARSMLQRALRPVSRMTRDAADWSEHDLDRRFDLGGPHDEITQLAATLDGMLERILQPVLDNAVQYGQGSVRTGVVARGRVAVISVCDDGPGVEPDEREPIFQPGVRGGAGVARPGAGLGLPLARRLARAGAGDVRVGEGRTGGFEIELPLAPS